MYGSIADCAGSKALSKTQSGVFVQPDADADSLNMLPTEEELLTCDCPFCVAYRGRSGNGRGMVAGSLSYQIVVVMMMPIIIWSDMVIMTTAIILGDRAVSFSAAKQLCGPLC